MTTPFPPPLPGGRVAFLFRGQALHLLFLAALLPAAWGLAAPSLGDDALLGVSDTDWFLICVGAAVLHQVYVWLGWRLQLGWQVFTRLFGRFDFFVWGLVFFPLLIVRPVLVLLLAIADAGSLALPTGPTTVLGAVLAIPALYVFWSIRRYFGFARAAGADHFREDVRHLPIVTDGAFGWTPNAMYTVAFLGLWSIALIAGSHAALVAALFQHAYIWVHYLCTEAPDMAVIYGDPGA